MMPRIVLSVLVFLLCLFRANAQTVFEIKESSVKFRSKAPKELISATTGKMQGVVDVDRRAFAFKISISSFEGFNSPLQREHFNENYMETFLFPVATFTGKIIEDVDLSHEGRYDVRAKGKLTIHGIEVERIIKCHLECKKGKVVVTSDFNVPLADHNIKIPRIVVAKLATDILVNVNATLVPKT
jgi:polyisoprenoid-binding protein YceI